MLSGKSHEAVGATSRLGGQVPLQFKLKLSQKNKGEKKKRNGLKKKKSSVKAQDASRVINLHHFIVLISSPITTTDCNHSIILIDNLGRSISDLGRLVS